MSVCKICEKEKSKYKCPTCRIPYCSLICFKRHKELPCEPKQEETKPKEVYRKEITPVGPADEEDPSRLTPEDLQKLAYSKDIHEYLEYPQIREIISRLDVSNTAEKDLDAIRAQDSIFDEFTKQLVDITFRNKKSA